MKFSIIVPLYNSGRYLETALDSLLSQTYGDFEAILVYDESKDETLDIAERFVEKDPRFSLIKNSERLGISLSRFEGVKAATGDYVLFLDGDDYYKPELLGFLEENAKDADVVIFNYLSVKGSHERPAVLKTSGEYTGPEALKLLLHDTVVRGFSWNKAIKRSLFKGENLVNPISMQGGVAEDTVFLVPLLYRAKKVLCYKKALYGYRQYKSSLSKIHVGNRAYHHLLFWELIGAYLERQGEEAYKLFKGAEFRFSLSLGYDFSFDNGGDREEFKKYEAAVKKEWKSLKEKGPFRGELYEGKSLDDVLVLL